MSSNTKARSPTRRKRRRRPERPKKPRPRQRSLDLNTLTEPRDRQTHINPVTVNSLARRQHLRSRWPRRLQLSCPSVRDRLRGVVILHPVSAREVIFSISHGSPVALTPRATALPTASEKMGCGCKLYSPGPFFLFSSSGRAPRYCESLFSSNSYHRLSRLRTSTDNSPRRPCCFLAVVS